MRILMVCLGNICRSPLAEGIMQAKLAERGLTDWLVDSAGTGAWHVGEPPDRRSIAVARQHGLDISAQRARQFVALDLERFDYILAMDRTNYRNILALATQPHQRQRVHLLLAAAFPHQPTAEVPDPYWDDHGFERVYQLLDQACEHLLAQLTAPRPA